MMGGKRFRLYLARVAFFALLLIGAFSVLLPETSHAATAGPYPSGSNKYVSVSREGAGIHLDAPYAVIKLSYSSDTNYYRLNFTRSGTLAANDVMMQICGSSSSGAKDMNSCTSQMDARTITELVAYNSSAQAAFAFGVNAPVDGNGRRNIYLNIIRNTPGITGYKITTSGFTQNNFTGSGQLARIGFAATDGVGSPMSLTRLPLTTASRSSYALEFSTPCNFPNSNGSFLLKWFDADRPPSTTPQDTQITWRLRNVTKNLTMTSAQYAFLSSQYSTEDAFLGGNNENRQQTVGDFFGYMTVDPGDDFVWEWLNVLDNNGVQFTLPYAETEYGISCGTPTPALGATCTIGSNVPDTMTAGRTYEVTLNVRNTGTQTWVNTGSNPIWMGSGADNYAGTTGVDARTTRDNTHWQASQPPPSPTGPTRLKLSSYPVAQNQTRTVTFTVRAPDTPGTHPFWWQMLSEGARWFGTPCKKNIEVVTPENRPYIAIHGGDVISGAAFTSSGQPCAPTTNARSANIKTNGYYGTGSSSLVMVLGQSNSQYAVFASGIIGDDTNYDAKNTFVGNYNHQRGGMPLPKDALFANKNLTSNQHGNLYRGGAGVPCIDITQIESQSSGTYTTNAQALTFLGNAENATRTANTNVTISARTLPAGKKKTLIVNGNVTISGSIAYPSSYANSGDIPYLRIIAKGNIYIQSGAQVVDAHLIAFPSSAATGIIDTCSSVGGAGAWATTLRLTTDSCSGQRLTVNGSMAARRILWKRVFGTLGDNNATVPGSCYLGNYSDSGDPPVITNIDSGVERYKKCAAEQVDLNGEAYIGSFIEGLTIDSMPITSRELPPIY